MKTNSMNREMTVHGFPFMGLIKSHLFINSLITWENHADVSPNEEVHDGVDEYEPTQPAKGGRVSSDGRDVRVAPMNS